MTSDEGLELPELERGGLSPTLRRFLVLAPHFSWALMAFHASSAVYMRLAIAESDRRIVSVYQSDGPL